MTQQSLRCVAFLPGQTALNISEVCSIAQALTTLSRRTLPLADDKGLDALRYSVSDSGAWFSGAGCRPNRYLNLRHLDRYLRAIDGRRGSSFSVEISVCCPRGARIMLTT